MRELVLFGLSPYGAAALLTGVLAWRLATPARRAALPDLCRESARLYGGSLAWRLGLGLVLAGHAAAFLVPRLMLLWNRAPARLLALEGIGMACGVAALLGLGLLVRQGGLGPPPRPAAEGGRGLLEAPADALLLGLAAVAIASGLAVSFVHRWGSAWYPLTLLPYARSLVALQPDVSLVLPLPPLVKLHLLAGIAAAAVLPFSRGLWALLWPLLWLWRQAAAPWLRRRAEMGGEAGGRWERLGRALGLAAELALAGLFGILLMGSLRRVGIHQGYAPEQPIAFSHKIHAGENGVPCMYCHFAAEKSRHAGIPPAGVCMNCHGQLKVATLEVEKLKEAVEQRRPIAWVKVHNLPDFVYFNHSQHVLGGIACRECHGRVETMERVSQVAPLSMGWCIGCHRARGVLPRPQRPLRPAAWKGPVATGGLDCGKCHY